MARITDIKDGLSRGGRQQTCKVCGCEDKFNFSVPDDLWKRVVPAKYRKRVVCLPCFDRFAFQSGIDYSDSLRVLYFAGDQAAFEFQTVSSASI